LNGEQDPGSNPGYSTINTLLWTRSGKATKRLSYLVNKVTQGRILQVVCLWWGRVGIDWRTIRWVELPGCKHGYRERKL